MLDYNRVREKGGKVSIGDALQNLRPGANWAHRGSLGTLEWRESDRGQSRPTNQEIEAEMQRLQEEYDNYKYRFEREEEYPDFREYLDAIVKGDEEQMQTYINKCLAVKSKYPKPQVKVGVGTT